jgi:hypothetical protein
MIGHDNENPLAGGVDIRGSVCNNLANLIRIQLHPGLAGSDDSHK